MGSQRKQCTHKNRSSHQAHISLSTGSWATTDWDASQSMPSTVYGHSECCKSQGLGSAYMVLDNNMRCTELLPSPLSFGQSPFIQAPLFTQWGKDNGLYESAVPEVQHTAIHEPLTNQSPPQVCTLLCVPVIRELDYTVSSLSEWGVGPHCDGQAVHRCSLWLQKGDAASSARTRDDKLEGQAPSKLRKLNYKYLFQKPKVLGLGTRTHMYNPMLYMGSLGGWGKKNPA